MLARWQSSLTVKLSSALPTTAGTALAAIKKAQVQAGQRVLINGASGGVGLFALQIAKAQGTHVTAVVSHYNFNLVKSFGADECVDYKTSNITKQKGVAFDKIIGVNGYHSVSDYKKILTADGFYIAIGGVRQVMEAAVLGKLLTLGQPRQIGFTSLFALKGNWVQELSDLVEAGKLRPYIDRVFSFAEVQKAVE